MGAGASSQTPPRYKWNQDHNLRGPWTFLFKEKVQCACEGSKWCTRENPAKQRSANAIPGLHSSWVGDKVLAMARPWQSHVEQFGLVAAFQQAKIGMILNLQEVGEHASCGPGNLPNSGYTYDPESFMAGGIGYYNFAWRDMGVPSLERMMDIVQVMDYVTHVEGRKIAVHCHAGLGRTGLAIACFFVFAGLYDTPEAAIASVRQNRPGAVQTSKQAAFVTIFAQYLQHLRCLFPPAPLAGKQPPAAAAAAASSHNKQQQMAPHSSSVADLAGAAANDGGGTPSLATRSAPPAGLPKDGLLESKETSNAVIGVYSSGLTVTVPLQAPGGDPAATATAAAADGDGGAAAAVAAAAGDSLTEAELGLQQHLPWNDAFQIRPQHAADFRPRPPRTYTEALARQARLLHGPERRAYLKLHKLVKEAVFAILAAAQSFQPGARNPARSILALPAILEDDLATAPTSPQHARSMTGGCGLGGGGGSPNAPALPPTFAHLLAFLITSHGPHNVDSAALAPLMAHKAYAAAVGPQVESHAVLAAAAALRQEVNAGRYGGLPGAPLLVVVLLLEAFFASFRSGPEPASLTAGCLSVISKSYQDLFNGQVPAPPSRPESRDGGATGAADGGGGAAAADGDAATTATSVSLEYARQAYEILEPLEARDFELLLVFAAMLRVVARGSGPGSEDAVVEVGKWATGLLLGTLRSLPEAEEAVLSFLWYLAGRDEAYAMLVLLKRQRLFGQLKRSKTPSGAADVAAMMAAAAAALAAPPAQPPAAAAPPPPPMAAAAAAEPPPSTSQGSETSTLVAPLLASPVAAGGAFAGSGGEAAAAAAIAVNPQTMPAVQLAQLLSQDIQQLYQVSFREALSGISTVLYPPPAATGRIEVHDVWR